MKILTLTALFGFILGLAYILLIPLSVSGERVFHYQWPVELAEHKQNMFEHSKYEKPSVILVGGSNLLYGVNSKYLSSLVDKPVFNYGLGVILGLDHLLDLVEPHIRSGDTVFLFLENEILSNGKLTYSGSIMNGLLDSKRFNEYSLFEKIIQLWHAPFSAVSGQINSNKSDLFNTMYHGSSLTPYGDIKSQLIMDNPPLYPFPKRAMTPTYQLHKNSKEILQIKIEAWRKRGVTVYAVPPPRYSNGHASSAYHENELAIADMYKDLDVEYLSHYTRHEYEAVYIHDSINHINLSGREINTKRIADAIAPMLDQRKKLP